MAFHFVTYKLRSTVRLEYPQRPKSVCRRGCYESQENHFKRFGEQ